MFQVVVCFVCIGTNIFHKRVCELGMTKLAFFTDPVNVISLLAGEDKVSFRLCSQNFGKQLFNVSHTCLSIRLVYFSVRVEQLGSYLMDFHEIWYLSLIFFSKKKNLS